MFGRALGCICSSPEEPRLQTKGRTCQMVKKNVILRIRNHLLGHIPCNESVQCYSLEA